MKTTSITMLVALFFVIVQFVHGGQIPAVPDMDVQLTLRVQIVQLAKDDGSDPVEVEGFIDYEQVQTCFDHANIRLEFLPIKPLNCTDAYNIETREEGRLLGTRSYSHPKVQGLYAEHPNDILFFFGNTRYGCVPMGSTGLCGFGYFEHVCFIAHGTVPRPYAYTTLAHEIAHAAGLGHVTDPNNLMHDEGTGQYTVELNEDQKRRLRATAFRLEHKEIARLNPDPIKIVSIAVIPGYIQLRVADVTTYKWYVIEQSTDLQTWGSVRTLCTDKANDYWFVPCNADEKKTGYYRIKPYEWWNFVQ